MPRTVSIVEARRELGRLAEEVRRTRRPVILTNRGRAVARLTPEPDPSVTMSRESPDRFAGLRGTVRLVGPFDALARDVRSLRRAFARNLERRVGRDSRRTKHDA